MPAPAMPVYARLIGTGSILPPRVVTNDELAADLARLGVTTSDEWIVERTGIRQRHLAEPGTRTSSLASEAARRALEDAGVSADEVDLIIVATSTPDYVFPSTACLVQAALGVTHGAAFDVQAACSGFAYALTTADSFVRAGRAARRFIRRALLACTICSSTSLLAFRSPVSIRRGSSSSVRFNASCATGCRLMRPAWSK